MIKNKKPANVEANLTKQQEVMLKRLLHQNDLNIPNIQDQKTTTNIDLATVSQAILNKLRWELAIITTEKLDDEWDHIIAGFDNPKFDWASAVPPNGCFASAHDNKAQTIVDRIASHFDKVVFAEIVLNEVDNQSLDHELLKHVLIEMFKMRDDVAKECLLSIDAMGYDECSCFTDKLINICHGDDLKSA